MRDADTDTQHEGNLRHHLKALNIPCTGTPAQWTENTEIKQYILDQMLIIAKKNGLSRAEMIKDVILTPEEWCVFLIRLWLGHDWR